MTADHPEDEGGYVIRPHMNALGLDFGVAGHITPFMPSPHGLVGKEHLRTSNLPRPRHIRQHTDLPVVVRVRRNRPASVLAMRALDLPPPTYDEAVSVAPSLSTANGYCTPALSPTIDLPPQHSSPRTHSARSPESLRPGHLGPVGDWFPAASRAERTPELREYEKLHVWKN